MRVFSLSAGFVVGSTLLLSACVSMYSVRPVVADNQVPVQNRGFESLSSTKKHLVQVGSAYNSQRQFDNPRFNVTFVNKGKFPVEFSTENVTVTFNGEPATVANGSTIGFRCSSPEQVQAFHDVAVAHGGTSIEEPPGLRQGGLGAMYLAYVRDPDGHKLCALHRVVTGA